MNYDVASEELLQDVEFECPGVTLNENVDDEEVFVDTTDATDATQDVSVDTRLPEHEFIKKVITGKYGKMKGKTTISFMLFMGSHTYKHRNNYKENHYFSCTDCLKHKRSVNAVANLVYGETKDEDKYVLQYAPPLEDHVCQQTGVEAIIKVAKLQMRQEVQADSNKEIPQIYEKIRKKSFKDLDEFAQIQLSQHFPSYRAVQSELYKERRSHVPPEPKCAADINLEKDLFYVDIDHKETMIKGDTLLDDQRRVILISTDAHLEMIARAKTLLADGTFKIAPSGFTQVFIISCQVDKNTYVPCLYAMLPDKKRDSYDAMFSMLKECLSRRGLSLSAQYFMSDYELNIKNSFMSFFPNTECKGCLFHYAKAVVGQVNKRGFKQDFSDVKKNGTFCGFIRAILGLPQVPLQRLNQGIRNLYIICRRLTGKQRSFGIKMIKYVEKVWIRGNHKPVSWNVHKEETVSTNNNSEGYNSKLGRKIKPHPNFYYLCGELKKELETSKLDAMAAKTGNTNENKFESRKAKLLEKKRSDMKEKLETGNVELMIYQQTMGGMLKVPDITAGDDEDEIFNGNNSECQIDEPIEIPKLESSSLSPFMAPSPFLINN